MRFIALVAIVALSSPMASACPPPGPCKKYKPRGPVEPFVTVYRRAIAAPPRRVDIPRFLAGSTWFPIKTMPSPRATIAARTLRLVAAADVDRTPTTSRIVLIRELESRNGDTFVSVDGAFYRLERCHEPSSAVTSCLRHFPDLPADSRFATPP